MCPRRSWGHCSNRRTAGFTLIEILIALVLVSVVVLGVSRGVISATRSWADHRGRLQTQQNLRSAVAGLSREVRIAGACMLPHDATPPATFQPLGGTESGTTDTIIVRANPRCADAQVVATCTACSTISVASGSTVNFVAGTRAYILNGAQTSGEVFRVKSVTASTIVVDPATLLGGTYLAPDAGNNFPAVFGFEQRTFAISTIGGIPTLTLTTLDLPQTALVKGIETLDIHYVLNRAYSAGTCDAQTGGSPNLCIVNLPASPGDWSLVRVVTFSIGARSTVPLRASGSADGFFHLSETFEITPRNFVFPLSAPRL